MKALDLLSLGDEDDVDVINGNLIVQVPRARGRAVCDANARYSSIPLTEVAA